MILSNYHTHSEFCDGVGRLEEYVVSALQQGMTSLGFSSHAPLPFETGWAMRNEAFPVYAAQISQLKRRYAGRLDVFLGLEVDYIPGLFSPTAPEIRRMDLDYTIGSVHFLGQLPDHSGWTVDCPFTEFEAGVQFSFGGNMKQAVEHYYSRMKTMVTFFPPDIIAHFDLIKRNNRGNYFFSEEDGWYHSLVASTLDVIAQSGCILEVNTGAVLNHTSAMLYPSEWILHECLTRNIPVTVNSDAHTPGKIAGYFEEIQGQLQEIGFRSIRVLTSEGWVEAPLHAQPRKR